jgi:hypothetical protein
LCSLIKKPKSLGLELIQSSHEKKIHDYQRRPSNSKASELQELLQLETKYGSSFEIYREIFDLCHKHNIHVYGLGSKHARLQARDRAATQRILKEGESSWVLFGEFHCARPHLPKLLLKAAPEKQLVILQQNTDKLQLQHLKEMRPQKDLIFESSLRSGPRLFCVLHTPLWVKWQSFLDLHVRHQIEFPEVDAQEQIVWCLKTLVKFLKDPRYPQPKSLDQLLDFSVFSVTDENFESAIQKLPKKEREEVLLSLETSRVAIAARQGQIFLGELTINSCAQAAGAHLIYHWSPLSHFHDNFYRHSLFECLSYLLSKVLNHSRKTRQWYDWEQRLKHRHQDKEATAVLKAREYFLDFFNRQEWTESLGEHSRLASLQLGRIIGDWVFEAFLTGEFSKQRFNRLLVDFPHTEQKQFERLVELKSVGESFKLHRKSSW